MLHFYCSILVVGVYHIDPNGGHPVDSLQVMCDFDESCSTCIDPNEMVGKKNQHSTLREIAHHTFPPISTACNSITTVWCCRKVIPKVVKPHRKKCMLGGNCTKLAAVICPAALSFFSTSSASPFSSLTKSTWFSSRCCRWQASGRNRGSPSSVETWPSALPSQDSGGELS